MKNLYSFILISVLSISAFAQKKADLSYHLELNKVYRVKNVAVQTTVQTVMGNEQNMQTNSTSIMSLKPLKQMDGEIIAEVKFDTILTIISQPPMEINSALPGDLNSSDPAKVMGCIMNRMTNSTFLVKLNNAGRVVEFINLEPTVKGILSGTDTLQGQTAAFIVGRAKMMVEENSLKSMIESVTAYMPGSVVKIGDTWDVNLSLSGGGMNFMSNGTYKLGGLEKKSASIEGDIIVESAPGTMEMNGAQITPDIRGIGKVELTVDAETGWIVKGEGKQQLKGELAVSAQGQNMTIPIEINSTNELVALP